MSLRERIRIVIFEAETPAGKLFDVALLVGLRLLRVFRAFELAQFIGEASMLRQALAASRHEIAVFPGTVAILVTILGTAMYIVEGAEHGFTSIPVAVDGSVVTMTTVGYGDLAPQGRSARCSRRS